MQTSFADALSKDVAELCPVLKAVVCPYAGTERIDRAGLSAGVRVINGGGIEQPIAEYVIAMLVAMRRKLLESDRNLRSGGARHRRRHSGRVVSLSG